MLYVSNYYQDDQDDHLEMCGEYHKWIIRNAYKILVSKHKGNDPLERHRHVRYVES
jgi:hypothetical protein